MTAYQGDFYYWTQNIARSLRAGNYSEVDMQTVAEEIERMGASERRELINRMAMLLMLLLKWAYQPGIRSRNWKLTIIEQRGEIQDLLEDSLKHELKSGLARAYSKALVKAERETNLPQSTFPSVCPYRFEQLMDEAFYPD
ncbi:MAG: DUF29 domain-containing protein [Gammaproteobacteria bacterium]|nr:DUF29 domain-containing protein [Gammaproteobacteria bacterium]